VPLDFLHFKASVEVTLDPYPWSKKGDLLGLESQLRVMIIFTPEFPSAATIVLGLTLDKWLFTKEPQALNDINLFFFIKKKLPSTFCWPFFFFEAIICFSQLSNCSGLIHEFEVWAAIFYGKAQKNPTSALERHTAHIQAWCSHEPLGISQMIEKVFISKLCAAKSLQPIPHWARTDIMKSTFFFRF